MVEMRVIPGTQPQVGLPQITPQPAAVPSVTQEPIPSTHSASPPASPSKGTHVALGPNHENYVRLLARNDFTSVSNFKLWKGISRQDLRADITQRLGLDPANNTKDAQALKTFDSFSCKARCSLILLLEKGIVNADDLKAWLSNVKTDPAGANAALYAKLPAPLTDEQAGVLVQMGTTCKEVQGLLNMAAAKTMANTERKIVNYHTGMPAVSLQETVVGTMTGTVASPMRDYLLSKRATILFGNRPLPAEVKQQAHDAVRYALHHGADGVPKETRLWMWSNRKKILAESPENRLSLLHSLQNVNPKDIGLFSGEASVGEFIANNKDALFAGAEGKVLAGIQEIVNGAEKRVAPPPQPKVEAAAPRRESESALLKEDKAILRLLYNNKTVESIAKDPEGYRPRSLLESGKFAVFDPTKLKKLSVEDLSTMQVNARNEVVKALIGEAITYKNFVPPPSLLA